MYVTSCIYREIINTTISTTYTGIYYIHQQYQGFTSLVKAFSVKSDKVLVSRMEQHQPGETKMGKIYKVTSDNFKGELVSAEVYKELRLQMSTGDLNTHTAVRVWQNDLSDKELEELVESDAELAQELGITEA
jgi:hypothetical protein